MTSIVISNYTKTGQQMNKTIEKKKRFTRNETQTREAINHAKKLFLG